MSAPIDADSGSYTGGSTTIDLGDENNPDNAPLDAPADRVVALIFTVAVQ